VSSGLGELGALVVAIADALLALYGEPAAAGSEPIEELAQRLRLLAERERERRRVEHERGFDERVRAERRDTPRGGGS
jgi:hypothetical protein